MFLKEYKIMRTIIQKDTKVYIYLRNEAVRQRFSQDADNEGITFDDGKKVAERAVDDIMALLPGGTICFLGFVGRMCYGSGSADAVRIDYEKYANGEENYLINSQ